MRRLKRGGAAVAFAALLFLGAVSASARDSAPDQRDPKHLTSEQLDPALYRFAPAQFPQGLPPVAPQGPARAAGLIIWHHGRDVAREALGLAPPVAWELARNGWDVYATTRHGTHDVRVIGKRIVAESVRQGLALGYRRVVLMGQSAGGFLALEAATERTDVAAVIALAPAAYGEAGKVPEATWLRNESDLAAFWPRLKNRGSKIVIAFFADDPYFEKQRPGHRSATARAMLTAMAVPHMVIAEPLPKSLQGHGAGAGLPFARRYAPCIVIFLEQPDPPACEDRDRAALATFGIQLPAPAPSAADALSGLWQGTSTNGRFIVVDLSDPAASGVRTARYILGRGVNAEAVSVTQLNLQQADGLWRWQNPPVSFELMRAEGGALRALRKDSSAPQQPATETLLQRLH